MPTFADIENASNRIRSHIRQTPILQSSLLNNWLGHRILFKAEHLQKVGAFKARGGCNAVARACESGTKPTRIVANSSGNHAQAVAWASRRFDIPATIFMPSNVSQVKAQATAAYGAEIVLGENRLAIDEMVERAALESGTLWIPPYNHSEVISGQGTAALEALDECGEVDALVAPCGGGGLLSGTFIAARELQPAAKVIGAEPLRANDAAKSRRQGSIVALDGPADTLADGARTPSVGPLTFEFIKQLDEFYEIDEPAIIYWSQWLSHLLKAHIEPTSAMAMEAARQWLKKQSRPKTVLVILSGGNIDQQTMRKLWASDCLSDQPTLD